MTYGSNSKRMKIDIEKTTKVKIFFLTHQAEILGVNKKFCNEPTGKERYAIIHSADLNTTIH